MLEWGGGGADLIELYCILQAPAQTYLRLLRLSLRRGKSLSELGQETGIPQLGKKVGGGQLGAGVGDPHLPPGLPQDTPLHLLAQVPVPESWVHYCRPNENLVET